MLCFFAKNYALKTLSPKRLKSLQQKSKEVSENYCTQSQPPFNLKRFGNYSVGELQISQNGQNKLWLKRLVNRTRPLCQTSNRYISTILFNYFFDTFCTKFKKKLKDSKRMTPRGRSTSRDDVEEKKKRMVNRPYWKHKNSLLALPCGTSESVKTSGKCGTDWSILVQHSTMVHQMQTSPKPLWKIANGM